MLQKLVKVFKKDTSTKKHKSEVQSQSSQSSAPPESSPLGPEDGDLASKQQARAPEGPGNALSATPAGSNKMSAETLAKQEQPVPPPPRPCPPYAAKSVVGQRFAMEDSWQAVPGLMTVPKWWTRDRRDHLPVPPPPREQLAADEEQQQQNAEAEAAPSAPQETGDATAASLSGSAPASATPSAPATGQSMPQTLLPAPASIDKSHKGEGPPDPGTLAAMYGMEPITVHFFAVYDGHGGADVAKHCAKNLHENLKKIVSISCSSTPAAADKGGKASTSNSGKPMQDAAPATGLAGTSVLAPHASSSHEANAEKAAAAPWPMRVEGLEAALKSAFLQTDSELATGRSAHEVGTTAVVSLVSTTHLWVGNVGDSRALLCRDAEAVALSLDHKATRSDEVSRVEQAGGYVWWDRVMGELAVSRAIGDHCLRPFVIAEPEVTYVLRRVEDQLLVLASDGLWDVFSNEEASSLALDKFRGELLRTSSSKQAVKKAASSLAKAALAKGSRDNITVIVVDVRLDAASASATATSTAAGKAMRVPHESNTPSEEGD